MTISIFIAALARSVEEEGDVEGIPSGKLMRSYLLNDADDGLLRYRYKILPCDEAIANCRPGCSKIVQRAKR